ncbi:hypothetical protein [Schleiferilactobacillus harbinensis]|uniref:hypothetical protein n=1 Tax=Schleiferilactobacillus harbinensis TaxID=304207 RepID=UPI0039EA2554
MTETVKDVFEECLERLRYRPDNKGDIFDREAVELHDRFESALAAETEAQKSCPYCHDPAEDDPASNLSDVIGTRMMIITHGTGAPYITTWDFDGAESKQINYCPMCGRRLEEK